MGAADCSTAGAADSLGVFFEQVKPDTNAPTARSAIKTLVIFPPYLK
jgi:hypothetical protein